MMNGFVEPEFADGYETAMEDFKMNEANINRKLDLIWTVLMALADKNFTDPELVTLLDELTDIDAKYRGEEPVAEEGVLAEKEVEA